MLRSLAGHCRRHYWTFPSPSLSAHYQRLPHPQTTTTTSSSSSLIPRSLALSHTRALSSGKSKARGLRLRGAGGVPGARYGGKLSTELVYRTDSVLESVRTPKPVLNPIRRWRIVRGDFVEVISGPDVGKRGRVLEVIRASNRVLVEGVAMVTKWVPQPDSERKKPVTTEGPIYVSRVAVICPETNRPARVRFEFLEDGTKVRVAHKSGAVIPRPDILRQRRKPRSDDPEDKKKDTTADVVLQKTYQDERQLYGQLDGGFEGNIDIVRAKE